MIYVLAIIALIMVVGLFYTVRTHRAFSTRNSEIDSEIHDNIRRHPILLNPVFLTYIIAIAVVLIYIIYLSFS
ncbi:hypothetical protein BIV60_25700 [Bacillus sp. MUM 116]|uniref:hypothetical protein n=1 Tax=Bacillus sp. MUM 116 TaxID=1678002 RepID=UPI0008F5B1B4|nr:hypothetical protein [Bacillus sp. MUM 116]OIK08607.1 hypothetical protein BIV60_25700 [Bacillus sp. MUM 116]